MFLSLENFNMDLFLRLDDEHIFIYYTDMESIETLQPLLPLGSFIDGKMKLISLLKPDRIKVSLEFMIRDGFAWRDPVSQEVFLVLEKFREEFTNIPEVTQLITKYTTKCKSNDPLNPPPAWCTECNNDCPEYCRGDSHCAIKIPITDIGADDLYYACIIYFNGIYRTTPLEAQDFTPYKTLTDIDFELNKYSLIVDIEEFFTKEFIWFINTKRGAAPFSGNYGSTIKEAIQTKNNGIRQRLVEDEINYFIKNFNIIYEDLVKVETIKIENFTSNLGSDSWRINVFAKIKQERLIYRIET